MHCVYNRAVPSPFALPFTIALGELADLSEIVRDRQDPEQTRVTDWREAKRLVPCTFRAIRRCHGCTMAAALDTMNMPVSCTVSGPVTFGNACHCSNITVRLERSGSAM